MSIPDIRATAQALLDAVELDYDAVKAYAYRLIEETEVVEHVIQEQREALVTLETRLYDMLNIVEKALQ